ncbi:MULTISPECIES: FeoA family protein [Xanthomarina]|uniref:Ferrous iron transport protein A n=2 Tax=Xanthomarina gelatinilytica TaxID=1137281 RepID=A0A3D6BPR1_9FLAO|nr:MULTISPECIES: FeoA family protein [Xanthomarina]MCB0388021.1 ferrous iron transport protein A [Winogradskyella sp.]MAL21829.1 ferrous iron transport protein A [Xanthomarina sp.]MAL22600.1 ferrous iron transport protein A [Xanthomarina sp.]MBF61143.1 ferrous iron transport protein A [Xanthomarina sp.]HAB26741.1 ferrous iron transport protein A [Xanthomarina gelatinilytica]
MQVTLAHLKRGERAIITDVSSIYIPLKLLEMGCLPGNEVELVQMAPFADPMYLNINGTHLAIRKETAIHILIEITHE